MSADDHVEMRLREVSHEVLVAESGIVRLGGAELEDLRRRAPSGRLLRARICAHPDGGDALHEMMIAHSRSSYIRPHSHPGKSESGHRVAGEVDVVFFDDDGEILDVVRLGDPSAGYAFYYRINGPVYHTVIVRSETAVVHEVTNGPFDPGDTVFAAWAPDDSDSDASQTYMRRLVERVASRV